MILDYLRERGFFNAEVKASPDTPSVTETQAAVTFLVNPNTQAMVTGFDIKIEGFDATKLPEIRSAPGEPFTRERLNKDVEKIRDALRKEKFSRARAERAARGLRPRKKFDRPRIDGQSGPDGFRIG